MNRFKRINNLTGWAIFAIAAITYLLTIEPTTSFWDCGEFIASSYKLEVGHPPGNPVFQLLGRFFSLFADKTHAAMMINAMSALCSAFTILFLFWTVTHLARRIMERGKEALSLGNTIAIMSAGAVGALVYTFSDTFWFSAVEAEVYAMSSLFTALVFWTILKWEEEADEKYANRWIILIAYLMGISIGVHLLNLLAIPAIALVYYFKKYKVSVWGLVKTLGLSVVMLGFMMQLIPGIPHFAGFFDLIFVNSFGMPYNSGAVFFMFLLMGALAWGIYYTHKKGRVLWNTVILCLAVFVIGFSSFAVVVIRSSANTPTNENQPDNAWSLLYYLNRDQYGSVPLLSGQTFATPPVAIEESTVYVKEDGKYLKKASLPSYKFDDNYTMAFPRMHSHQPEHIEHYKQYTSGRGKLVAGTDERMPTFRDNLSYFFDYQLGWMYWRYFMWNFAGRQNDIQGHGDSFHGNWECGIPFIDEARLGNIDEMPPYLANHKSRNHYYLLPLLLGAAGFLFQLKKDKRNFFVVGALFVLTGIAIVVYLNQTPYQPRERDYAYAGSFYAYAIWIGLGAMALYELLRKKMPTTAAAAVSGALCLIIPIQMGAVNWADHDRSNRYTARDMAYNYLMSCEKDALLFTIGDNDTFPLWYLQEVEGVRTDVRIVNTSLLGTDWYIDQMKYQMYDSPPVPFKLARKSYLIGTNDYVQIVERVSEPQNLKDIMAFIADPRAQVALNSGEKVAYLPARSFIIPVNKENILKSAGISQQSDSARMPGIATAGATAAYASSNIDADKIPDSITITIPKKTASEKEKTSITKPELMILDLLANNDWKRPIYFVSQGGDIDLGFRDYLQYNGFAYKLTPIRNTSRDPQGLLDKDQMYDRLMNVYRWGNMSDPKVLMDWNNYMTIDIILNIRNMHSRVADAFITAGDTTKALALLNRVMEIMPEQIFPYNASVYQNDVAMIGIIEEYYLAGKTEKANAIVENMLDMADKNLTFFGRAKVGGSQEVQINLLSLQRLGQLCNLYNKDLAKKAEEKMDFYMKYMGNMQ